MIGIGVEAAGGSATVAVGTWIGATFGGLERANDDIDACESAVGVGGWSKEEPRKDEKDESELDGR